MKEQKKSSWGAAMVSFFKEYLLKISRNKQILTLKKLYPELNKVSTVEIYKITKKRRNGNLQRWDGDLLLTSRIKQKKRG